MKGWAIQERIDGTYYAGSPTLPAWVPELRDAVFYLHKRDAERRREVLGVAEDCVLVPVHFVGESS